MLTGKLNRILYDDFVVLNSSGVRVSGLTNVDFTKKLYNPAGAEVSGSITVTVVELGDGSYRANYTPNAIGLWKLDVFNTTYFPEGKTNNHQILVNDVDILDYEGAIWYKDGGNAGTVEGLNGTRRNPSNSPANMSTLAAALGLRKYKILDAYNTGFVADVNYSTWEFEGADPSNSFLDVNNKWFRRCSFKNIGLYGVFDAPTDGNWNILVARDSLLYYLENCYSIEARDCNLAGDFTCVDNNNNTFSFFNAFNCVVDYGWADSFISFDIDSGVTGGFYATFFNYTGGIKLLNMQAGEVWFYGKGRLIIDATCTGGTFYVSDNIEITNNATGVTIVYVPGDMTEFLYKMADGEWELVAPNDLHYYEKGTRTGPGVGTILRSFKTYNAAGQPSITNIARVE